MTHHPKVDLKRWNRLFPLSNFEKKKGRRRFTPTEPGDPVDLWKAHGRNISSPVDLAVTEQVRNRTARRTELGEAIPVDIFLWAAGAPERPYLTKVGGVPHRARDKRWPRTRDGRLMTFVVQFCFLDSRDIVPRRLPGDVMLIFFRDAHSYFGKRADVRIEWSSRELARPTSKEECPPSSFFVPELAGVIHRTHEYPEAWDIFENLGHYQSWHFATTQSTKIGQATWFIQSDPRRKDESLLCTFNSLQPAKRWPFTNVASIKNSKDKGGMHDWGEYTIMFGDVGCMYFLVDRKRNVRWECDCY